MGYAAGTTAEPTYYNIGDHAECIQVGFDPEMISFRSVLKHFWGWHNPFRAPWSRQYMSAVLYHDAEQGRAIEESVREFGEQPATEIQEYRGFTLAEDYHQKYFLRRNTLVTGELVKRYPRLEQFVDSYEATKANAVMGGHLRLTQEELNRLALSERARSTLTR